MKYDQRQIDAQNRQMARNRDLLQIATQRVAEQVWGDEWLSHCTSPDCVEKHHQGWAVGIGYTVRADGEKRGWAMMWMGEDNDEATITLTPETLDTMIADLQELREVMRDR